MVCVRARMHHIPAYSTHGRSYGKHDNKILVTGLLSAVGSSIHIAAPYAQRCRNTCHKAMGTNRQCRGIICRLPLKQYYLCSR
jgi:hypothetical protein